jgi:RNA polymerase sigma-70 factor (ECF subfamily)
VVRESNPEEDRELVRRCKEGDEEAFSVLVRKYQQTVFNVVYHNLGYRDEVEDVAQKVFSKVFFSLSKFDNERPFFPWLYRIAINQCYDELRRRRRSRVMTFTEMNLEDTSAIERVLNQPELRAESADDQRELLELLRKLLDQLPPPQRTALVLRDLEDVPYERMAEILNCTEQAARLKVFRARTRLREMLEKAVRRQQRARS